MQNLEQESEFLMPRHCSLRSSQREGFRAPGLKLPYCDPESSHHSGVNDSFCSCQTGSGGVPQSQANACACFGQ